MWIHINNPQNKISCLKKVVVNDLLCDTISMKFKSCRPAQCTFNGYTMYLMATQVTQCTFNGLMV